MAAAQATQMTTEVSVHEDEIVGAMVRARVRPAIIHAYKRTGLWITEVNRAVHSEEDLAAWDAAIDEYEQEHQKEPVDERDTIDTGVDPSDRCGLDEVPPIREETGEGQPVGDGL